MLGAVELGGTYTVVAIGCAGKIIESLRFPTTNFRTTIGEICEFFENRDVEALGVAAFGPVIVDPLNPSYGKILHTPKHGWSGNNIQTSLAYQLNVPVMLDTDVGCAALGEYRHGAHTGCRTLVYITVGTGIGVGLVTDSKIHHGRLHPEFGHLSMVRAPQDDFEGVCPFHRCCAESLASGPALNVRTGRDPSTIPQNDPVWELESWYLSQLAAGCIQAYSPDVIIMGGGVMSNMFLIDMIREGVRHIDNGYLLEDGVEFIFPASLNGNQALLGCLDLAEGVKPSELTSP